MKAVYREIQITLSRHPAGNTALTMSKSVRESRSCLYWHKGWMFMYLKNIEMSDAASYNLWYCWKTWILVKKNKGVGV